MKEKVASRILSLSGRKGIVDGKANSGDTDSLEASLGRAELEVQMERSSRQFKKTLSIHNSNLRTLSKNLLYVRETFNNHILGIFRV